MVLGSIMIAVCLIMVAMGMPIAVALLLASAIGVSLLLGPQGMFQMLGPALQSYIADYTFAVIPLFIFMGQLGHSTGLFSNMFETARAWLGRLPGGLGISVVMANVIFGAMSGSTVSASIVIGKSALPVMRKAGYPDDMATGLVAGCGGLAALIPPSIAMVIYGLIVQESVGKLLIAGYLPGVLSACVFVFFILLQARKLPRLDHQRYTWADKFFSVRYLWAAILTVVLIISGIFFGFFTPTEAAAVGAAAILILALLSRQFTWPALREALSATVSTSGTLLILMIGALFFGRFLVLSGFSKELTTAVVGSGLSPLGFFMVVVGIYLVLGCFVGATGMMVMTLPILYPIALSFGFDPLWFGVVVVILSEIAFLTPPVGVNLYAVKSVAPDVPLSTIIRGSMAFVFRDLVVIAILYLFPQIATFLPEVMFGK